MRLRGMEANAPQHLRRRFLLPKISTGGEMKIMVTGHAGYIGSVLTPMLIHAGHEVIGFDADFFAGCDFNHDVVAVPSVHKDIRDVVPNDLKGFDAVIHLAALSNDPLSDLNPVSTYEINHQASVRLSEAAKMAGVPGFFFLFM